MINRRLGRLPLRIGRAAELPERRRVPALAQAWDILLSLTASDLHARYGRGPWQLLKWLIDPFAVVGVYLVLVSVVLDRPGRAPGLSIACAVVPFQLVMTTSQNAMGALNLRATIILNMAFRRMLIPVAAALTETVAFCASLVLLPMMMAIYGIGPTRAVAWLPVVAALTVVFAVACAYAGSLLSLWFADLRPFATSLLRTLFFLAPGLVALSRIHGLARDLIRLNPLSGLFEGFRAILLEGHRPAAWQLGVPLVWALAMLALFGWLFSREESQLAKALG